MPDENATAVESAAAPEVQAEAEKLGWIPPSRFRGDPERFVDAEEYIKRGETVLPIVKEHNRRLQGELKALQENQAKTEAALAAATKAIEEIEERHSVATQKAVEDARRQLKAQLAAASEADDHEGVAELTDRLTRLNTAEKEAKPAAETKPAEFKPDPELVAWNEDNPWFGTNKRRTALMIGIAQDLRDAGNRDTGRKFYDACLAEMNKELGVTEPRGDKVEGGRNGSEGDARSGARGGKSYANLPADAKAACDADARQFVGPAKKYKTVAEWRNRYAEIYFEQGA